ncbi:MULTISPECIES: hypothetical protein [unclassified Nocardioides]|uniref:hypothetical protein n=1 Tax=unclassified Nocardioides TaxID=2615069 RepID=UPI0006FF2BA6|nr:MULTISPECIES: hypothetical protein [unclassified Nocardioides]KRA38323.1 hypothetical protein ASD81_06700 [Nocardioides sp. Root614]KRA92282.1 hypothetical protein ASD84_06965 [Nocardioides sp. Root682]
MSTDDTLDPIERPREERPADARPSGWHQVNTGHLVMGTAFVGLVIVWALLTSDTVQLENSGWILPLPWLVGGGLGLVATMLRGPRHHAAKAAWMQHYADHGYQHGGGPAHMKGWLHDPSDKGDKNRQA